MGKKRKTTDDGELELPAKQLSSKVAKKSEKRLIIILEGAHLETCKAGKSFELLNIDDHRGILSRNGREFSSARPDITHQCLLMLFDSPLNRAGLLQVFIRTANNVLIEINPATRIPRTFKRFSGLFVQLLHKYSITAAESSTKLLKVIKNPVTDHLPAGCRKICMTYGAEKVVHPSKLVPTGDNSEDPIVLVVGAIAKGSISPDYIEENVSISNYPLSAALACTKLCDAFEQAWGIF